VSDIPDQPAASAVPTPAGPEIHRLNDDIAASTGTRPLASGVEGSCLHLRLDGISASVPAGTTCCGAELCTRVAIGRGRRLRSRRLQHRRILLWLYCSGAPRQWRSRPARPLPHPRSDALRFLDLAFTPAPVVSTGVFWPWAVKALSPVTSCPLPASAPCLVLQWGQHGQYANLRRIRGCIRNIRHYRSLYSLLSCSKVSCCVTAAGTCPAVGSANSFPHAWCSGRW